MMTLWCIFVVLSSLLAVGLPLRWLLGGGRPLDEDAWIQVPFLGLAAAVLFFQNLVIPKDYCIWC